MGQDRVLTEATVRRFARSQSYERGERYYDEDAVVELVEQGDRLRAEVVGSQSEPYRVTIELGDVEIVDTSCSCPYDHGGICKHRVAVLLTYLRDPEAVTRLAPISDRLADCDRNTLHDVLVQLLDEHPELVEDINQYLDAEPEATTNTSDGTEAVSGRHQPQDPEDFRRRVQAIVDLSDSRDASDPYAEMEQRVDALYNLTDDAWTLIEQGRGEAALDILVPIAEELMDGEWLRLSYDDSTAIFEFLDELGTAFTEALLITDLSDAERDTWANRLQDWVDELASYTRHPPFRVAVTAAERGWDHDALQAVLNGSAEEPPLWDGDRPWYADVLTQARLAVLEREGRTDEYERLARAEQQVAQYATKLIDEERTTEATEYAQEHVSTPADALRVATTLRAQDHPQAAIRVARQGLSHEGKQKAETAAWLRELAAEHGDQDTATKAAITAFKTAPSLTAYQAAEDVAPDSEWPELRTELLDYLADQSPDRDTAIAHVEIFLSEGRLDEAIDLADDIGHYSVVERVVDAVWEKCPEWAIAACKEQAAPIIEEGQSDRYQHAVRWLEKAGKAAQAAGQLEEWRDYVESIRERHSQKYKLVPMLDELLAEF